MDKLTDKPEQLNLLFDAPMAVEVIADHDGSKRCNVISFVALKNSRENNAAPISESREQIIESLLLKAKGLNW
jgi:hypothetical protein